MCSDYLLNLSSIWTLANLLASFISSDANGAFLLDAAGVVLTDSDCSEEACAYTCSAPELTSGLLILGSGPSDGFFAIVLPPCLLRKF